MDSIGSYGSLTTHRLVLVVGMNNETEYLRQMNNYPMALQLSIARDRIRTASWDHELYVSFSGGIDSSVAVDVTARLFKELGYDTMHVLTIRNGLEYKSCMSFVDIFCELVSKRHGINIIVDTRYPSMGFADVIKTFGYPLISKEVSSSIMEARKGIENNDGSYSYRLKRLEGCYMDPRTGERSSYNMEQYHYLLDSPIPIASECCHRTKVEPAVAYEQETGYVPVIATMAEESRLRRTSWLRYGCNAFEKGRKVSRPFSMCTRQSMLEYLYVNRLPVAGAYGKIRRDFSCGKCSYYTTGCSRTGCLYCMYGIAHDPYRFARLQNMPEEEKRVDWALRGGRYDSRGMWVPDEDGLGLWFVIDYLNKYGNMQIVYENRTRYRRF